MFSKHFPPSLPLCILYFVFHKGKDTFAISPPSIHHLARRKGILKGNPNFQGILNWIIQILHYYCRKQHKNIENSWIIEQNVAISLSALHSAYCNMHFLCFPQRQGIFSSWTQSWTSQLIISGVYSFIFCFENSFL